MLVCLKIEKTIPSPAHHWPQTCFKDKSELFEVQETATSIASEAFLPQSPGTLSFSFIIVSRSGQNSKIIQWEFEKNFYNRPADKRTKRTLLPVLWKHPSKFHTNDLSHQPDTWFFELLYFRGRFFWEESTHCFLAQQCGNKGDNPLMNYYFTLAAGYSSVNPADSCFHYQIPQPW